MWFDPCTNSQALASLLMWAWGCLKLYGLLCWSLPWSCFYCDLPYLNNDGESIFVGLNIKQSGSVLVVCWVLAILAGSSFLAKSSPYLPSTVLLTCLPILSAKQFPFSILHWGRSSWSPSLQPHRCLIAASFSSYSSASGTYWPHLRTW